MSERNHPPALLISCLLRIAGLFAFWITLAGAKPADLLVGLAAAAAAAWVSTRLLPPLPIRPRISPLASLAWHFLWSSILAGVDVAYRALHPRLPLCPGFLTCTCRSPAGALRELFLAMASLMPGSLPIGVDEQRKILTHCLDTGQPVGDQMAKSEARFLRALGERGDR